MFTRFLGCEHRNTIYSSPVANTVNSYLEDGRKNLEVDRRWVP